MAQYLPVGVPLVDDRFGGVRRGALTVLAGYPTTGKTGILSDIAEALAVPTLFFGGECRPAPSGNRRRRADLFIDTTVHRNFDAIEARVAAARQTLGIQAVIIDDLHRYNGVRYDNYGAPLRRRFAQFASRHNVALLVSWTVTDREDSSRRARWSDLRGTILEEPYMLMLLHPESDVPPVSNLHIICQDGHSPIMSEQLYLRS